MKNNPLPEGFSLILRGTVGSTVHGLNLEGTDDKDEMGVCIEPASAAITLGSGFEQFIYRTAAERTGIRDARSEPGDLDLTIFSLRKFCRLAANGNPTVLLLLYTPEFTWNATGGQLRDNRDWFVSKEAGARFLGYMQGQLQRLLGERGQKRVKRPELEEKYGFDTKYASHVLRLGYQGIEFITTGKLTLPMREPDRSYLLGVRQGKLSLEGVIKEARCLDAELKIALEKSPLPEHPNREAIEKWIQMVYVNRWAAQRPHETYLGQVTSQGDRA